MPTRCGRTTVHICRKRTTGRFRDQAGGGSGCGPLRITRCRDTRRGTWAEQGRASHRAEGALDTIKTTDGVIFDRIVPLRGPMGAGAVGRAVTLPPAGGRELPRRGAWGSLALRDGLWTWSYTYPSEKEAVADMARRGMRRATTNRAEGSLHFGLTHGGDGSVRTTLRKGDLAFFDTLTAGLVPVRISEVVKGGHGNVVGGGSVIRARVTAARPAYPLGYEVVTSANKIVPRTHIVRRGKYSMLIDTRYQIV